LEHVDVCSAVALDELVVVDQDRPMGTPLTWCYRAIAVGLAVCDAACSLIGLLVADRILEHWAAPAPNVLWPVIVVPLTWVGAFHAFGLYNVRQLSALEEFRRLIGATCVAASLVSLLRTWSDIPPYRRSLLLTWVVALSLNLMARRFWRWQLRRLRSNGHLTARTVILGTNEEARRLNRSLSDPGLGFHLIGHVSTTDDPTSRLPLVGRLDQLDQVVRSVGADCIFVATTAVPAEEMPQVAEVARRTGVELKMSANVTDVLVSRLSVQSYDGALALSVRPVRMSATQAALKRTFDMCLGVLAIVASLPLMAAVAVAVRLSSPGPVLFRQDRVTKHGRVFVMLKFRTMSQAALPDGHEIDLTTPFFKLRDDPRLTPVGRFLRKFSLDELPQLWHVVRGDLSLVGPRPLPAIQVAGTSPAMRSRHQVRAGLTGWWQVNGRSDIDPEQALRMDLVYIQNWSLSLDLFILCRTLGTVLFHRGAC
jgi:exopolysaccharide biosynthesis polyprenyl glycosylphosphotransferase